MIGHFSRSLAVHASIRQGMGERLASECGLVCVRLLRLRLSEDKAQAQTGKLQGYDVGLGGFAADNGEFVCMYK